MKFDYCIGNPAYNADFTNSGDNGNYAAPVYNDFLDAAYEVSNKVEMIHPARFLFNAGSTPKKWNSKMLNDEHFKVLKYEPNSSNVFSNTDIMGGIAISYHDNNKNFGKIEVFTPYDELNSLLKKVKPMTDKGTFDSIITGRGVYKLSKLALEEYPEIESIQSKGHKFDVGSGAFKILKDCIFFENKPETNEEYVRFLGLSNNKRDYFWTEEKYQNVPDSFYHYKVFIPQANGSRALGEAGATPLIGEPVIGLPHEGATETFLSIGCFETEQEAKACLKYIKGKFARSMLGILKITQANTRDKWKYVPIQDFTSTSDIDWSKSIPEIDQQLYRKYGLSEEEINFIETHVKEMN